ncbi:hypothetical protein HanRHA438_Chr16g0737261 [Helianthus annuus]|nr:hypothetical protein HanRHA438_Chr16g0737261 [Helianthus annuus]
MNKIVTDEYVTHKPMLQRLTLNSSRNGKLIQLCTRFQNKRESVCVRRHTSPTHLDEEKQCIFRQREESMGANDGVPTKGGGTADEIEYRVEVVI